MQREENRDKERKRRDGMLERESEGDKKGR